MCDWIQLQLIFPISPIPLGNCRWLTDGDFVNRGRIIDAFEVDEAKPRMSKFVGKFYNVDKYPLQKVVYVINADSYMHTVVFNRNFFICHKITPRLPLDLPQVEAV